MRAQVVDHRVAPGADTEGYLAAVREVLAQVPSRPRIAFYLAGADPLEGDALGGLAVTRAGLRARDRAVLTTLGRTPTVILPAGGYHDASWHVLAGTLAQAAGLPTSVRAGYDPVFRRVLDVSRTLDPEQLSGTDAWLTEEELLESLGVPVRAREHRFLGFYTRHGLGHALEMYGYLPALRHLGLTELRVELPATHEGPDSHADHGLGRRPA